LMDVAYNSVKHHPAILLGGRRDYLVEDIKVEGNAVSQPNFDGIRIDGFVTTIALTSNAITNVSFGMQAIKISDEARPHVTLA
jgi:hypothetical protein